ncbi:kielin/chordin-like protein [Toxorhynchites rutilus septentrionalis]|uniref:kielin/chordin-like protein n=1 Tax=Toxorhynchites rutilus septentrionalis TaxID=329112 RepID=UPI00247941DF|nr:kielin/chordin-like protein [Toxorhynchites rutilus septentrionalis]
MLGKVNTVVIVLCAIVTLCNAKCDDPCSVPPKHYSELGCKPIKDDGHCCPNRYECPTLTDRDGQKCYFNGNIYEPGNSLSKKDQEMVSCSPGCRCDNRTTPATFTCAYIDCPEFFGRDEKCIYQYSPYDCCASGRSCGNEVEKLNECYFDGEKYLEGQKIYPKDESCYTCHCQKDFDNSTVVGNPNCYEISCGIELRNLNSVIQGCIPVYFGNDRCCPISWRCPDDKDTVVVEGRLDADELADPKMQCTFGKLTINFGDSISSDDKCLTCKCTVPPMPHCIQTRDC